MARLSYFTRFFALGVLLAAVPALAVPVGLYSTGVDDSGVPLPAGSVDLHYTLTVTPDSNINPVVVNDEWPVGILYPAWNEGPWVPHTEYSKWIGPRRDPINGNPPGTYTYQTMFDLTESDAATATINGRWAADNDAQMFLNGNLISSVPFLNFFGWTNFSLSSGLVAGTNILTFIVNNGDIVSNPTGLRVEFRDSFDPDPIPEPATLALLGAGLLVLGVVRARRRRADS